MIFSESKWVKLHAVNAVMNAINLCCCVTEYECNACGGGIILGGYHNVLPNLLPGLHSWEAC